MEPTTRRRVARPVRSRGGGRLLCGLALLLTLLAVRSRPAPAEAGRSARDGAAFADSLAPTVSLAPTDSLALADSLAAAFGDSLALADTLALADSLALADTLALERALLRLPRTNARGPDHHGLRLELGASTDLTNERYYEDETDSTFQVVGRRTITTPETRYAGVLFAGLDGTRGRRSTRYTLDNHLSLGDRVQRGASWLTWRSELSPEWMLVLTPRLEASHDRTFGRDLSEWRAGATSRLRRALGESGLGAEVGVGGDLVRARGAGAEFIPNREALNGSLAIERDGLWDDWRAAVAWTARSYPDSAVRNHRDLGVEARWRRSFENGDWLALEAGALRRRTVRPAPTTRDDLSEARAALEGEARAGQAWSLTGRLEGEGLQYETPDSTLYFDQTILRGWLAPRFAAGPWLGVAAGPRAEWLVSPIDPAEEYSELGGAVEFESFGGGAWWRLAPAAGRRAYRHERQRGRFDPVGLHTDYDFVELDLLADQGLGAGWRLRVLASGRLERHNDSSDDSSSLYFSLDLRRLLSPGSSGVAAVRSTARFVRPGF